MQTNSRELSSSAPKDTLSLQYIGSYVTMRCYTKITTFIPQDIATKFDQKPEDYNNRRSAKTNKNHVIFIQVLC